MTRESRSPECMVRRHPPIPLQRRVRRGSLLGVVVLATLLPAPAAGQDQDAADRALAGASERFAEITVLCADFRQVLDVTLLGETRESRGRLCQRQPNLFFMRFSEPPEDQIVADGDFFWIYYASVNPDQVVRIPLDPAQGGLDFYREFLDRPGEKYDAVLEGEETVAGRPTLRIRLAPRAPRAYRAARVWIDPDESMIRQVEITENNGTVRLITLDSLEVDPPLGAEDFTFRVPEGVTVVSGAGP